MEWVWCFVASAGLTALYFFAVGLIIRTTDSRIAREMVDFCRERREFNEGLSRDLQLKAAKYKSKSIWKHPMRD